MDTKGFLRSHGIQPSQQRLRIYEALAAVKSHPDAETIYRKLIGELPTLSRTTVFTTLDLFVRASLAQRLAITGTELRYDADTSRHTHFLCRSCGEVHDLARLTPPEAPSAPDGYLFESSQYFIEGLCPRCRDIPGAMLAPER